ncbi:hypothetical protein [Dactylosporangium sp. CS-033363]|uniref:hypothetical protein n=1 Tax=Dactylosporangium sp. CS-033363 TaxID=3239935 RepID=UPI003D92D867
MTEASLERSAPPPDSSPDSPFPEQDPWEGIPLALLAGAAGYDTDTAGGCG